MKLTAEEIVDVQNKYGSIELNFGKHKGKTLMELSQNGEISYLTWLHKTLRQNEKLSPTQRAIFKYIDAVYMQDH